MALDNHHGTSLTNWFWSFGATLSLLMKQSPDVFHHIYWKKCKDFTALNLDRQSRRQTRWQLDHHHCLTNWFWSLGAILSLLMKQLSSAMWRDVMTSEVVQHLVNFKAWGLNERQLPSPKICRAFAFIIFPSFTSIGTVLLLLLFVVGYIERPFPVANLLNNLCS